MKKSNKIFLIIFLVGFTIAIFEVVYLYINRVKIFGSNEPIIQEPVATTTKKFFVRRLDGVAVEKEEEAKASVVGIMIDNHPAARPQNGLVEASVVYEAPVEGGITRFFAFFDTLSKVEKVGPVRSARPYFLDWLSEYGNTSYWHSGGSQEALDLIKIIKIWDVNEFYNGKYFWRDAGRDAPHNLFTSSVNWSKFVSNTPHVEPDWQGWKFDPNLSDSFTSSEVKELQIRYESNYLVGWQYDQVAKRYLRLQNGRPATNEAGEQIFADSVVVQIVEVEILDEEGRKKITTIGTGDARVLRNGRMVRGSWKKDSRTNRTRFFDVGNREIPLQPGKIWVQMVPSDSQMEVSS